MANVSVRLDDDLVAELDAEASERGISRAEYIRELLRSRHEYSVSTSEHAQLQAEYDQLQDDHGQLQQELERLRREKRLILEDREEHTELVEAVERDMTLQEKRAQAGVLTRAKWYVFGMDDE